MSIRSVFSQWRQAFPAQPPAAQPPAAPAAPAPAPMPRDQWLIDLGLPKPAPAPVAAPAKPTEPIKPGGRVPTHLNTKYIKDPSFANDGKPIGGKRYAVFGDLRTLYVKGLDLTAGPDGKAGNLNFHGNETPIKIDGLPKGVDSVWAPQITVQGDKVVLLYSGGTMNQSGLHWDTFRLRMATVPLADFIAQTQSGQPIHFKEHGALFDDQKTFGGDDRNFGMIDPHLFTNQEGRSYLTYTVVKPGVPGRRPHEEFVRYREVDPKNPARAIGPDLPMYDGKAGTADDGVAEAQDVVTLKGKTYAFISSRAGDKDQKILMAEVSPNLGRIAPHQLKPFLTPGGDGWQGKAVGSSSVVEMDGQAYMLYQGLDADQRFTLGWKRIDL